MSQSTHTLQAGHSISACMRVQRSLEEPGVAGGQERGRAVGQVRKERDVICYIFVGVAC